jgi:hypothetical protein
MSFEAIITDPATQYYLSVSFLAGPILKVKELFNIMVYSNLIREAMIPFITFLGEIFALDRIYAGYQIINKAVMYAIIRPANPFILYVKKLLT